MYNKLYTVHSWENDACPHKVQCGNLLWEDGAKSTRFFKGKTKPTHSLLHAYPLINRLWQDSLMAKSQLKTILCARVWERENSQSGESLKPLYYCSGTLREAVSCTVAPDASPCVVYHLPMTFHCCFFQLKDVLITVDDSGTSPFIFIKVGQGCINIYHFPWSS